jgi:hypothetical protein
MRNVNRQGAIVDLTTTRTRVPGYASTPLHRNGEETGVRLAFFNQPDNFTHAPRS